MEHAIAGDSPFAAADDRALSIHELIRRHHDSLIGFLRRRLSVPEDAQDVAQETYIRMMKYEGARDIESPSSMLFRIAANVATDLGRAAHARRSSDHLPLENVELVSEQPSAERDTAARQSLDLLCAAVEALPTKCRQVFLLSRAHGMTYPEIARHCGISVKMVEKHISHALAVCMRQVGGSGGDTSI